LVLIKKHRLFKQALSFYQHSVALTKKLNMAFGEYLEQRGYPEEAGFLYQQAGELPLALHAFKKSLNLEMTLSVLSQMK
jgi:hypothetical protein